MNKETWKDVIGYVGLYQVSNLGRIRSLGRECNSKNGSKQRKKERILTQEVTIHGYCRVRLFDADGNAKHYAVHRLVMNAFIGIQMKIFCFIPQHPMLSMQEPMKTVTRLEEIVLTMADQL